MTVILVLLQLSDFIEGLSQVINQSAFLCMVCYRVCGWVNISYLFYFSFLLRYEQCDALPYEIAK